MRSFPGIPFLLTYRFLDRNSDSVKGFQIETPVELKDAMEGLLLRDFRREESRQDSDLKKRILAGECLFNQRSLGRRFLLKGCPKKRSQGGSPN